MLACKTFLVSLPKTTISNAINPHKYTNIFIKIFNIPIY